MGSCVAMPWFRVLPRSRCSKTTVTSTLSEYLDGSLNGPCTPASGGQGLIRYETPSSSRINCQADRQGREHGGQRTYRTTKRRGHRSTALWDADSHHGRFPG